MIDLRINKGNGTTEVVDVEVVQGTDSSTKNAMSQDATTKELKKRVSVTTYESDMTELNESVNNRVTTEDHEISIHHINSKLMGKLDISYLNTLVDPNSSIKPANPIINLFSNKIEKSGNFLEYKSTTFNKVSTGVYELLDCPPLASSGWYLEQPNDRNNNIYHNVDWEYDDTNSILTIRVYSRLWDGVTGEYNNHNPMDIKEGRFISLRFENDPSLYPVE